MRTKFALAFYYVAIAALVVTAGGIVWRLIIFPPCTPTGNTCVVDPGTVVGLASSVLGVAATVLAILGAVAVAAWWTSLNERVTEHVNKLYENHKTEISKQLSDFLADQQREVRTQLSTVQTSLQTVESRIGTASTDIDHLEQLTHDIEEIAVDGLMIMRPARELEEWAKRAIANHRFPKIAVKMAARYITDLERDLLQAERGLLRDKEDLDKDSLRFKEVAESKATTDPDRWKLDLHEIVYMHKKLELWLGEVSDRDYFYRAISDWEGVLRWKKIAEDEKVDIESLQGINGKIEDYRPYMAELRLDHDNLKVQTQILFVRIDEYLKTSKEEAERTVIIAQSQDA
ncbi:MAG TPA: hypothetical protein VF043_12995 [Ktedonobacteraceae bacterium]